MRQIAILFLFLVGQLRAQQITTSFFPASVQENVGADISLELKVTGFTGILTFQFPVVFNSKVLQFLSASDFGIPGFTANHVSYQPLPTPRITVSYDANPIQFPNGVSLAAGGTLMKLNFKVIESGISTVNLASNLNPTIEFINNAGNPVNVIFQGSGATVTGGNGVPPPPPLVGFHVIAGNVTGNVGQQVCVPIRVHDFKDIESMQFAMHFDPSKLSYVNVQNFGLPGLDASTIIVQSGTGLVNLIWSDPGEVINGVPVIDGVTLPNGTKIFDICFNVLGPPNTATQITIDGVGIVGGAEVINHAGQNVWTATSGVTGTVFMQAAPDPNAVTFILDTATVLQNEVKCLDLRVRNFQSIDVVQLPFTYDHTRLQLLNDTTHPIILSGAGNNPLNLAVGSHLTIPPTSGNGRIKMSWIDQGANGVSLPDNTKLLQLCFRGIGPVGSTNPVEIKPFVDNTGNTFIIEIRKNGVAVPVTPNLRHGHVYITNVPPCSSSADLQSKTDPKCHNGSNGSIQVTTSGTGTLTHAWSGPQGFTASTANISSLKPGVYTLTVTSSAGCSSTLSVTLNNPPAITAFGTGTPVSCFGGNDGSIQLTVSGGTGNFTFNWSGPGNFSSTSQNPAGLTAGNYSVTLSDANQCTLISSQILVATPSPIRIATTGGGALSISNVSCAGGSDGAINFGTEGGSPPYTFHWSGPGISNPNVFPPLSNLTQGFYQVTITDSKGCTIVSQTLPITAPQPIIVTKDAETPVKCLGDNNGSIAISVSGGNGGYSYRWVDGTGQQVSNVQDPSGLPAGTYRVTVTDAKLCTGTLPNPVTIASPAAELNVHAPTVKDITCPGGNDGSITLNITGGWSGTPSIQWSPSLPPQPVVTGVPANTYSVTVTDAQGCSRVRTGIEVKAPPPFNLQTLAVNHLKCHNSGDGSITVNITGGNLPYASVVWTPGGLSGTTISNLSGGTYVPTVTDAKQCTQVFGGITINAPQPLSVSEVVVNANGSVNGSITLSVSGGTPNYSYSWSHPGLPNSPTVSVPAGTYTVVITDLNNCQVVRTYVVEQLNPFIPFTANISNATVTCFEAATACVTITIPPNVNPASKPVTITYPGLQTPIVSSNNNIEVCGLSGGIKTFTVTPASGLPIVLQVNIQTHTPVAHNEKLTNPNEDFKNGAIDLSPLFPFGNYSYSWRWIDNGVVKTATTQDLINLDSGLYCVTITDLNTLCTISDCKRLNRIWQPISGSEEIVPPTCKYSSDGSIKLILSGGRAPYRFKWSGVPGVNYPNSNIISNLRAGSYVVTVTDENGTTWSKSWTLTPRSNLSGSATVAPGPNGFNVSGPNICDGKVSIATTGQFGTVKFLWNNGATTASNNTLCKGDWWVIVSDALGCADTLSGSLTAPPAVVFGTNLTNYNGYNVRCHGGNDAEAAVTISGGVPPYQVVWSTGFSQIIQTASGLTRQTALKAGKYSLTVTDANDVKNIHEFTITEPEEFVIDFKEKLPERFTECDGSFTLISNGATPVKYNWISQVTTGTTNVIENLCANEKVSVLAVDANGCRATAEKRMGYPDDGCLIFRPVLTPGQSVGKNDDLFITCIESVPDNSLEIYNRWGQLVYQVKNYDNDSKVWRGTNIKGQPLPEGVYYYILNYINSRGENMQAKGYVNLLR